MLHDIGKTSCLDNDDDHAEKGYEICMAHDLGAIADIVAEHVILKNYLPEAGLTEKEIVYYAREAGFPPAPPPCPAGQHSTRELMRQILDKVEESHPKARVHLWRAVERHRPADDPKRT